MKNILIRADSSSSIGIGHIMRDLVLASSFENAHIIFATLDLPGNINHRIKKSNFTVKILNSNNIHEIIHLIHLYKIDMIIIDHYGISYKDEKQIKEETDVEIFVLDDTYNKHYCDILLNHNLYAKKALYKSLVPKHCEIRCGAKYTLLRDEFKDERTHYKRVAPASKIFIAMGGADSQKMNISILKEVVKLPFSINVVTTTANKNLQQLKEFTRDKNNINLYIDSKNIAKLMAESDIAIVTPSVVVNEVCFMKVPIIAILVTTNQEIMFNYLKESGVFTLKKEELAKLEQYLKKLLDIKIYSEQIEKITKLIQA